MDIENIVEHNQLIHGLIVGAGVITATLLVVAILHFVLARLKVWAEKTHGDWDDLVVYTLTGTKAWAIFIWFSVLALPLLKLHDSVNKAGRHIAVLATGVQVLIWGLRAIRHWRENYLQKKLAVESDGSSIAAIGLLGSALQMILVVIVVLLAMSNLGIDVGALIAGLGIGGIAVALAAQNILGDLLASLSIVLDKPFVVGDYIVVGDKQGTVENIGIKTTRLRALSGEQLVFSNKALLESQIQNFKRMWERRVVLSIGVTYSTSLERLKQIPVWIKGFIDEDPGLRFDRAHLARFGGSSLDFEIVFYILSPDTIPYMNLQQKLLLKIYDKFFQEGVEFAFPSQSLYIEKLPKDSGSPKLRDMGL